MELQEILDLPVADIAAARSHLYLWCPNALVMEGLRVMKAWGFTYKSNIVWFKIRKDGGPDGRGVGFYFRNVTELVLFGVRGSMRTLKPGRTQVNTLATRKREHSRKPDELTTSSNHARLAHISNCLRGSDVKDGPNGATKTSNGIHLIRSHIEKAMLNRRCDCWNPLRATGDRVCLLPPTSLASSSNEPFK